MESFDEKSKLFWSVTTCCIYVKSLVCILSTLLGIPGAESFTVVFFGGWHTVDIAQRCGHGVRIPTMCSTFLQLNSAAFFENFFTPLIDEV